MPNPSRQTRPSTRASKALKRSASIHCFSRLPLDQVSHDQPYRALWSHSIMRSNSCLRSQSRNFACHGSSRTTRTSAPPRRTNGCTRGSLQRLAGPSPTAQLVATRPPRDPCPGAHEKDTRKGRTYLTVASAPTGPTMNRSCHRCSTPISTLRKHRWETQLDRRKVSVGMLPRPR